MDKKVTIGIRLVLMLVDHFAMTFVIMGLGLLTFGMVFLIELIEDDHWTLIIVLGIMVPLMFSVYLNKDALNGQSPAKRILKFQVIDHKSHEVASPLQCLIRNLFIPFWILEIPFVLINPERKLGDLIAGTRIVKHETNEKVKPKIKELLTSIFIGIVYMAIIFFVYYYLTALEDGVTLKDIIGIN